MPRPTRGDWSKAREVVWVRDSHFCQMCGRSIINGESSTHHRVNRGMGGSGRLERPSLLIRACGNGITGCHGRVTTQPRWAERIGWLLPKNNPQLDPTREPILTVHGWVLLDDLGNRTPCEPAVAS